MSEESGLESIIGYRFGDFSLVSRAVTRLAYAKENGLPDTAHMDALATLGDAVIDLLILHRLVNDGGYDKGRLTVEKMDLVNMSSLRKVAEQVHLERYIHWGKGESLMHVWTSGRVLAECVEAVIGAVYLDGGLSAALDVLIRLDLFSTREDTKR